jgi:transcriptional regulator
MYVPPHFREDDLAEIHAVIGESRLCTLVSFGPNGLRASHVPMRLEVEPGELGTLVCHLARANDQWHDLKAGGEALAIVVGPEAYVSPSAYATKRKTGKVVPTWNYVAVHAYGVPTVIESASELHELVEGLTDVRERTRAKAWKVSDAPEPFIASQLNAIVGVSLAVTRYDAKWKMSQNRTPEDMRGVVEDLSASDVPSERDAARIVAERLARRSNVEAP